MNSVPCGGERRTMRAMRRAYVLDTSAVMTVLHDEPGASSVVQILDDAREGRADVALPFLALMEVEYLLLRRVEWERAEGVIGLIENWPVEIVESTPEWRRYAARVKAAGGLSIADAWMASLAMLRDAELLHKDSEFDSVDGLKSARL